jgi:hypothetical protein
MRTLLIAAAMAGCATGSTLVHAQTLDERASARAVIARRGDAIVIVLGKLQVVTVVDGRQVQSEEQPLQVNATVLDAKGLAVMSLSALDPGKLMTSVAGRSAGAGRPTVVIKTEASGLKMRLPDGREVAATVASRNEPLDLAFIRPTVAVTAPMPFVDGPSAKPGVLDLLVVVQRLSAFASWKTTASFAYVQTILDQPRLSYLVAGSTGGPGVAAFDPSGAFVGIMIMRTAAPAANSPVGSMLADLSGTDALGMMPVILAADEIRAAARTLANF